MPHPAELDVTHVLFDMDGVLLDTEPLYTAAINTVAQRHGSPLTVTWDLKVRQLGLPSDELAKLMIKELKLPIGPEQFTKEVREIQQTTFPDCQLMPGAEKLVRHLKTLPNMQIAVATSSPQETFDLKTQKHKNFFSLFSHVVCGYSDPEVKHGKPAPDIFQVCASRFKSPPGVPHPASCLVIEDSPVGVKAALAAGMRCLMVPDPRMFETPDYIPDGVTLVLKSLLDLDPEAIMRACNAYY